MNLMRSLKYRILFIIVLLIATAAVTAIFVWPTPKQGQNGLAIYTQTLETYSLDTSTNPPRWIKTIQKIDAIRRDARGMPQKEGHTTKITLPGSKVAFIEFTGVGVKSGPQILLKVNGNGGSMPNDTYLIVDKVKISDLRAVKMTFRTSEFFDLILENLKIDGTTLDYQTGQNVPTYPPFNPSEWGGLPGLALTNIKTDQIVIEVSGSDTTIGELRFTDIRIPGEVVFERLKGNEFSLKNSSFGNGDGNDLTKSLIIESTVKVKNHDKTNVKQNEVIDNR